MMVPHVQLGLAFSFALSATVLMGQEVASLDLVDIKPGTELRHPAPPPPVCKEDGTCTVSGGLVGVSIGCGGVGLEEPRALKTSLVSLDRFAYAPDDAVEMEITIANVGSVDMNLPWNPHLADLQPTDETQPFHYSSLAIILKLTSRTDEKKHSEIIEAAKLYGVTGEPATMKLLKPGQWVRLRVKTKLAVSSGNLKPDADYSANVVPELRSETFVPNVKAGGFSTDIANDYPRRLAGPDLMLRIIKGGEVQNNEY